MTPNPQNIGAAPEEYPIRAQVRADAAQEIYSHMPQPGSEIWVKRAGDAYWCSGGFVWSPSSLDILPDAVGVPEAKPKGPSLPEVTQPGEGVDLEAIEARLKEAGEGPWKSDAAWVMLSTLKAILADGPALIAEIRSLRASDEAMRTAGQEIADAPSFWDPGTNPRILTVSVAQESMEKFRATLRRESK